MEKKSVPATILVLFLTMLFSVIGICFSVFKYSETKITVENIKISAKGIEVFEDEKLTKKATKLKLSDMELGLKPATGQIDEESLVPSTITDEGTSEGYYASIYVPAGKSFKVLVKNIKIKTDLNKTEAQEERKNIYVSIKDIKNSTKTLEKDEFEIASFENGNETYKITFLIWLGSLAGEELAGAKISFQIEIVEK